MNRTIFILLDGMRYSTARECLGYMEALIANAEAQVYKVSSELPSISRPLYETLMSGLPPVAHGIVSNNIVRRSQVTNVFSLATASGLITSAAAYHWFFELYNQAPFTPEFRHVENFSGDICNGAFYWEDHYPDSHLFADADVLLTRHAPDFLLLHSMNIDNAGHQYGGSSREYRNAVRRVSDLLALYLPHWRAAGYTILITSDHGMSDDGNHGGPHEIETSVPLYTVGADVFSLEPNLSLAQTQIAGVICTLLGLGSLAQPSAPKLFKQGIML